MLARYRNLVTPLALVRRGHPHLHGEPLVLPGRRDARADRCDGGVLDPRDRGPGPDVRGPQGTRRPRPSRSRARPSPATCSATPGRACCGCRSGSSSASSGSWPAGTSSPGRAGPTAGRRCSGFWTNAVKVPATGQAPITFEWYRSFLQFLIDNHAQGWFAWLVTLGEMAVGIGLLLGALTGIAAFFGSTHEHVVPARRLGLGQPDHVRLRRRADAGLEGRRLLRRRPVSPPSARRPVARSSRPAVAGDRP